MNKPKISVFWFRRDLRLEDNCGLFHALNANYPVLPIFIFDDEILNELPEDDARVSFIYNSLVTIQQKLTELGASLLVLKGKTTEIWNTILKEYNVQQVYVNKDYEPYAIARDYRIANLCLSKNIDFLSFKDQVIFEEGEILKEDGLPYTVFTPFKNKWLKKYSTSTLVLFPSEKIVNGFIKCTISLTSLNEIGFVQSKIKVVPINKLCITNYGNTRDIPSKETSNVSVYLRFGLISIRKLMDYAIKTDATYASELIWREFFMQIIFHFPKVVNQNFKPKYNGIPWRNNEEDFKLWCEGKTGYPIVDAGMRQLNNTGFMHNRVRMITASFLCKHLLIDWRWGEAYFAQKLLDYELSSNNGNWQWVAGTGCDAAPYYRVFNPITQQQKFDSNLAYIKKWLSGTNSHTIIIDHKMARERYLEAMKLVNQ